MEVRKTVLLTARFGRSEKLLSAQKSSPIFSQKLHIFPLIKVLCWAVVALTAKRYKLNLS